MYCPRASALERTLLFAVDRTLIACGVCTGGKPGLAATHAKTPSVTCRKSQEASRAEEADSVIAQRNP
jgi:hypothetical protein